MSASQSDYVRRMALLLGLAAAGLGAKAQSPKPLEIKQPILDKNFELLGLLEQDSAAKIELAADASLHAIARERQRALESAIKSCRPDGLCLMRGILWTDEEIEAVAIALREMESHSPAVHALVAGSLRSSGANILEQKQSDANLLESAWQITARGINHIIEVYGEGAAPRYPLIDSLAVDPKSSDYQSWLLSMVQPLDQNAGGPFFEPSLTIALTLLGKNHRDEAGRMEPMETGINAPAVRAVQGTSWQRYPYTVIVVPGAGPENRDKPLSAAGHERVQLAADAYRAGDAPFILVSGGYVHPAQTRFAEAVEMKRVLIDEFHIPESAILEDPHARHTTTNMRNAAREIYRYGMPMDRPALVITDVPQTDRIASAAFADRCLREMGYVPFQLIRQKSSTEIEFLPRIESLEQDPMDPLDP